MKIPARERRDGDRMLAEFSRKAFPDYVSGHSTFSSAGATVLATFYGRDDISFKTGSDFLPGVFRSFRSFSAAASEAARSRVYGGITSDLPAMTGWPPASASASGPSRTTSGISGGDLYHLLNRGATLELRWLPSPSGVHLATTPPGPTQTPMPKSCGSETI